VDTSPGSEHAGHRHHHPEEGEGDPGYVRVDDGVVEGGEVSMFYDPMIAKLITWGETRDAAADLQVSALDRFELEGVGNNLDFLSAIMQHPRFRSGELTTGFIAEEYPEGFSGAPAAEGLTAKLAAIAAILAAVGSLRAGQISGKLSGAPEVSRHWVALFDGHKHKVALDDAQVVVDQRAMIVELSVRPGQRLVQARIDGEWLAVRVEWGRGHWKLTTRGASHRVRVYRPQVAKLARHMIEKVPPDMSKVLLAPMPGLLTRLHVAPGDKVEAGQPLAVVEAMKMENILRAERAGVVKAANFAPGDSMAVDAAILEFE
jgi:propionyl-CoA carboxylase alpha chain